MKPLDLRLLRSARPAGPSVAALVGLGATSAALVIAQAQVLATAIAAAVTAGANLAALRDSLLTLAVVIAARAGVVWAVEATAHRAGAAVTSRLHRDLLVHAVALGPGWLADRRRGELATSGIDALDGYIAGYLPQLVLAVLVPATVVTRTGLADPLSAAVIVVTVPLIPLFGALVGASTGHAARRRWRTLAVLAHHFLVVVSGLSTLRVFGRAGAQRETIAAVTDDYRRATMGTLRLAFLSATVLELVATLSVALVAGTGMTAIAVRRWSRNGRTGHRRLAVAHWLTIAAIAGTVAAACSIGLLATAVWLISRAAGRPPVLDLVVAAAAVQAFGLGRATLRYAERLAGHDVALRMLAAVRTSVYARLERLAPAGLGGFPPATCPPAWSVTSTRSRTGGC